MPDAEEELGEEDDVRSRTYVRDAVGEVEAQYITLEERRPRIPDGTPPSSDAETGGRYRSGAVGRKFREIICIYKSDLDVTVRCICSYLGVKCTDTRICVAYSVDGKYVSHPWRGAKKERFAVRMPRPRVERGSSAGHSLVMTGKPCADADHSASGLFYRWSRMV